MRKTGIILIIFSFLLMACSSENEELIGLSPDTIGLSARNVYFDFSKSCGMILTEGQKWWITSIDSNEKIVYPEYTAETILNNIKITGEWFQVERVDLKTIIIDVTDNVDNNSREFTITLQSGNYFDHILVRQNGRSKNDIWKMSII